MNVTLKQFFYWGAGAVALVALAGPQPELATALVVLIMVGVVLTHYQQYAALLHMP